MSEHVKRLFAAEECERLVEQVLAARRLRTSVFKSGLFSDPAWDILLNLYLSELRHESVTMAGLAEATGLSQATTSRWLDVLAREGLARFRSCTENRDQSIGLTPMGASGMRRWFGLWLNGSEHDEVGGLLQRMLSQGR